MADKTIPELSPVSSIDENALLIIDTGIETFKITAGNAALFFRDAILPAGVINPYAGAAVPSGWLICDGSEVSRTTYAKLFIAIGATYGVGNGSTTFNVPDLRGRFPAGKDDMGGSAANRITNGVAGFVGTTLGASGGAQAVTPTGSIGGSQSIAHVHTGLSHTHAYAHNHEWGYLDATASPNPVVRTLIASDLNKSTIAGADSGFMVRSFSDPGSGTKHLQLFNESTSRHLFTTGVAVSNTSTNGNAAETASSTVNISGMSTNDTVNGSNFSFTGVATHRIPPALVVNYIIKT